MEKEVDMKPVVNSSSAPVEGPQKAIIELDPLLYSKMYRLITEVNNSVKMHRVTGKPLKLGKKAS